MPKNLSVFIGRITKDIELRHTPSGTAVTDFTLAVDAGWGQRKHTLWVNVTAWDKEAERLAEYAKKGSALDITAEYEQDNYEKDGEKKTQHKFILRSWEFAMTGSSKPKNEDDSEDESEEESEEVEETKPVAKKPVAKSAPPAKPQSKPVAKQQYDNKKSGGKRSSIEDEDDSKPIKF
jgi:single-strand DNA-binding protein